jgi:predicted nucleic acid-binding Zn finger protein
MSTNATDANESTAFDRLDARDRRALVEHIAILPDIGPARDAPGVFLAVGEHGGGEYVVDVETGACTCPDATYNLPDGNRTTCKHVAAARLATGRREVPAPVTPADVRDDLAEHVDESPTYAVHADAPAPDVPPATVDTAGAAVATDGGRVVEPPVGDDTDADTADSRPDDCECHPAWSDDVTPCFACWRAGFDVPNPDAPAPAADGATGSEGRR